MSWSPTSEGVRTIFRRPVLWLAEISWRWSFGGVAWLLTLFGLFEYLDTLPVSSRDRLLLRSGTPAFISRALAHILRGSGLRVLLAGVVVAGALALLWIVLASLGRAATLAPLLESIRARARSVAVAGPEESSHGREGVESSSAPIRALAGLHALRVMLLLATVLAFAGALSAAHLLSPGSDPNPTAAVFALLVLAGLIVIIAWSLNWLLSLATLFVVRDGQDTMGAISAAIVLCGERLGAVSVVGTLFGLAHLTFFVIATSVVGFPLSFQGMVPAGFVLLGVGLLTLLYFAVADALYIGRLAGYAAILEAPAAVAPEVSPVVLPPSGQAAHQLAALNTEEERAQVDQEEVILSDTQPPEGGDE